MLREMADLYKLKNSDFCLQQKWFRATSKSKKPKILVDLETLKNTIYIYKLMEQIVEKNMFCKF